MENIYVIGHKNPDTDSVISAITAAYFMGYAPAIAGPINRETAFILEKFEVKTPEILTNIAGKKVFLVDHNESTQIIDGFETASIIGVLDHHKINFSSAFPIFFRAETLGSTSSLIAKIYMEEVKNNSLMAGLLLSAILSDTIIFKSPTTTSEDKEIAHVLANIVGINDVIDFGIQIKTAGADISNRSVKEIIQSDFKDFDINGKKIGIGQIELPDIALIKDMESEIIADLEKIKSSEYELVIMAVTDIIKEGSQLFFAGDKEVIKNIFGIVPQNNSIFIPGLMSRKKQIVPPLELFYK